MAETRDTNGQFVSKNWLIVILVGLVCFFGGIGIRDTLAKTKEHEERISSVESRVLVLETQNRYVVSTLEEMKADIKEIKREVKK